MKNTLLKKPLFTLIFIILFCLGSFLVLIHKLSLADKIICSKHNSFRLPSKFLCKFDLKYLSKVSPSLRGYDEIATSAIGLSLPFKDEGDDPEYAFETIKILKDKGFDINEHSSLNGLTPLHDAVLTKDTQTVKFLINLGADINATVSTPFNNKSKLFGMTPLELAIFLSKKGNDMSEIIRLLKKE